MLEAFRLALVEEDEPLVASLAATLRAAVPAPKKAVRAFFGDDPELERMALAVLKEQRNRTG